MGRERQRGRGNKRGGDGRTYRKGEREGGVCVGGGAYTERITVGQTDGQTEIGRQIQIHRYLASISSAARCIGVTVGTP